MASGPLARRQLVGLCVFVGAGCKSTLRWAPGPDPRHPVPTHHCEVLGAALGAPVVAGQEHVLDVVARAVIELAHVERPWLVAVEVRLLLQHLQHVLLHQVGVTDLVPRNEAGRGGVGIKG